MTDTNSTDDGSTATALADGGTGAGTQAAPEGFVPLADLEREQARARDFQANADRTKAELEALRRQVNAGAGKPDVADDDPLAGFDPEAFRRSLIGDVYAANSIASQLTGLKAKFPLADGSIWDRAADYGNVDALYLAAEASHNSVAARVDAEVATREAALRAEFDAKHGGSGSPAGGDVGAPAGDPTVEQLNAMSLGELRVFEADNPGVAQRILRSA